MQGAPSECPSPPMGDMQASRAMPVGMDKFMSRGEGREGVGTLTF